MLFSMDNLNKQKNSRISCDFSLTCVSVIRAVTIKQIKNCAKGLPITIF